MNILVTGANGQLGQELQHLPQSERMNYIFTDVEELDITRKQEIESFIDRYKVDVIINCAAYTDVEGAEREVAKAEQINVEAVANLAEVAKQRGVTLIHISTDYVFGEGADSPILEDTQIAPLSVYGRTKALGEVAIVQSGCKYIIIRTSWLYSPYGKNFVKSILRLSHEKCELRVVNDQVGSPTYAADLANALATIVASDNLDKVGIYHYSNEGAISWYDFAKAVVELEGGECSVLPCSSTEYKTTAQRPNYSVLDKTKIKTTFGVSTPHWRDSLAGCLAKIG